MRNTRTTLAWITIILVICGGLICAVRTGVSDTAVQEQLTSTVMELAEAIAEALREDYTYTYTFPHGIHLYIGGKEDDDGCDNPHP